MSALRLRRPNARSSSDTYYVSLADLLIGLIFIFIIMLVASALSYQEAEKRADQFQTQLNERADIRRELLEGLRQDLRAERIDAQIDVRNGVLRLPEHTLFGSGRADLDEEGRRAVQLLARSLRSRLPCYGHESSRRDCDERTAPILEAVYVEGHTDNQPIGPGNRFTSNWELSSARAITTYRALLASAPELAGIRNVQNTATLLGVSAYAEQRGVGDNATEEGRRMNRRIDLRFLLAPTGSR